MRHPNVQRRLRQQKDKARLFYELRQKKRQEKTPVPSDEELAGPEVARAWRGWLWVIAGIAALTAIGAAVDWLLRQ